MSTRFDIKAWRESSQGKAYTVRIGSAWVDQKGVTRMSFDALPIPDKDGRVACFLEEQRDREVSSHAGDNSSVTRTTPRAGNGYSDARGAPAKQPERDKPRLEDDIPW